jgi:hypothetical protein
MAIVLGAAHITAIDDRDIFRMRNVLKLYDSQWLAGGEGKQCRSPGECQRAKSHRQRSR